MARTRGEVGGKAKEGRCLLGRRAAGQIRYIELMMMMMLLLLLLLC